MRGTEEARVRYVGPCDEEGDCFQVEIKGRLGELWIEIEREKDAEDGKCVEVQTEENGRWKGKGRA